MQIGKTVKMYNLATGEEVHVALNTEHKIDNQVFVIIKDKQKNRFLRMAKDSLSANKVVTGTTGQV